MKFSKRHILKTIKWRDIGSLDTLLLSYFISRDLSIGIQIGKSETEEYVQKLREKKRSSKLNLKRKFFKTLYGG